MEYLSVFLNVFMLIFGFALLIVSVSLIRLIKNNTDKTVAAILHKINKLTTACALLAVAEAAVVIAGIIIR